MKNPEDRFPPSFLTTPKEVEKGKSVLLLNWKS